MQHLDKVIDFIMKHIKYNDRNRIKQYLEKHIEFGTFDYAIDGEGNIVGCVRFNISDDGLIMDIFDFSVDKQWRRKGVGKDLLLRGLERFPNVKYLRFQRVIRGDDRFRTLPVDTIIKRNIL